MPTKKTSRNHSLHAKIIKDGRGLSPVISTIIVSGTLLIILVIASFVSANILELQIASTEFEQAKTNMMLLDQVIQDVAMRRGAGGYVQFNQRSGGIGIYQHTETLKIFGPSQITVATKPPTTTSGSWTSPTNAYADDSNFASTSNDKATQSYGGYGFAIPAGSNITKVRVRLDAYTAGNEKIRLYVSADGGSSWLAITWLSDTLPTSETTFWVEITGWTTWSLTKINDNKIWTRVEHVLSGGASQTRLDWIPVEVTFVPPLSLICESPNLVSLVYRGGSKVSGTDLNITGTNKLNVSLTNALGYLRVETDNGLKIKLDYFRVRIVEMGSLLVDGALTSVIEVTLIQLEKNETTGSGTVNVKAQNINIDTTTRAYDTTGNITLNVVKYGTNGDIEDYEDPTFPVAAKTVIMVTVITVKISISQG